MTQQNPWEWDESVWRPIVEHVQPGGSLAPGVWPNEARAAVAISFDSDHEAASLHAGETSPGVLAQGTYGARVGVPRLMKLLGEHNIPATWFVPAVSAMMYPQEAKGYVEAGHEIALHGWIHESPLSVPADVERELLFRAADKLEELSGRRPVGLRTPTWDVSEHTLAIAKDLGLIYDSSLMFEDDPCWIIQDGVNTGMVEIPVDWIRDDAPYFMMRRNPSARPYISPRDVLEIWKSEFVESYANGGVFQLTMHPHISGHLSRVAILRELFEFMGGYGDLWYATHAQIAEYVRVQAGKEVAQR